MKIANYYASAAPILNPISYPGLWLPHSAVISDDRLEFVELHHLEELRVGKIPILAIGSNAAPAQLRHKLLGRSFSMLNLLAEAPFSVGYASFKSPYGAIPATPVFDGGGAVIRCQFVTEDELEALDATEFPHYVRSTVKAKVEYLGELEAQVYSAAYEPLRDDRGNPVKLKPIHADGLSQSEVLEAHGDKLPTATSGQRVSHT